MEGAQQRAQVSFRLAPLPDSPQQSLYLSILLLVCLHVCLLDSGLPEGRTVPHFPGTGTSNNPYRKSAMIFPLLPFVN